MKLNKIYKTRREEIRLDRWGNWIWMQYVRLDEVDKIDWVWMKLDEIDEVDKIKWDKMRWMRLDETDEIDKLKWDRWN